MRLYETPIKLIKVETEKSSSLMTQRGLKALLLRHKR